MSSQLRPVTFPVLAEVLPDGLLVACLGSGCNGIGVDGGRRWRRRSCVGIVETGVETGVGFIDTGDGFIESGVETGIVLIENA